MLRVEIPDDLEPLSDDAIRARCISALQRARICRLEPGDDTMTFVALVFVLSGRFDEQPAFRRVLHDSALSSGEKINALFDCVGAVAWGEARTARQ
jgi:hypothetical protein